MRPKCDQFFFFLIKTVKRTNIRHVINKINNCRFRWNEKILIVNNGYISTIQTIRYSHEMVDWWSLTIARRQWLISSIFLNTSYYIVPEMIFVRLVIEHSDWHAGAHCWLFYKIHEWIVNYKFIDFRNPLVLFNAFSRRFYIWNEIHHKQ